MVRRAGYSCAKGAAMKPRLWFIRETAAAVLYSKLPPDRHPGPEDEVWIPRSVIEQRTKFPTGEHHLTVVEWFAEKQNL
jgi:hypothetical protein